jgi:hypothetical protein
LITRDRHSAILSRTGRFSERRRCLPADSVVLFGWSLQWPSLPPTQSPRFGADYTGFAVIAFE